MSAVLKKTDVFSYKRTPQRRFSGYEEETKSSFEVKIGVIGLFCCICVLIAKIYCNYSEDLRSLLFEQRLITYETITEDGEVMLKHAWTKAAKYSSIWLPVVCGLLTAYFTGLIVYLDSSVPGVQPPSPFSPTKYKQRSGHTFHLNYVIAIALGFFVAIYMYWRGASVEF